MRQRPAEPMTAVPAPPVAQVAAPGAARPQRRTRPAAVAQRRPLASAATVRHQIAPAPARRGERFERVGTRPRRPATAGGGERFAFFAAFRAAAEQAREEAGIDDRRGH